MSDRRYQTFAEFWPHYVREHSVRGNRRLHWIGTALGLVLLCYALLTRRFFLILAVPLIGYGFAWVGHFFVQKNVPATFKYPFFSLMGDFKMFWLMATGRMDQEIVKAFDRKQLAEKRRKQES